MKKFSLLALAAVGLLFGACSSDKDVVSENNDEFKGKTEGFFKINLNLPTTPQVSTRAWEESAGGTDDPTLNDGLSAEYDVNSLILLLFDGATESTAKLKQVINLTASQDAVNDDPNQITTKGEYVAKLNNAPTGNLYALAVVNGTGIIEMGSETTVSICGEEAVGDITIGTLQAATAASTSVSANAFINSNKFFMTNAVLSNEKGGTVEPTTAAGNMHILAPVDKSLIYDTEAKAIAGSAATDIYVERGVAKVTIKSASLGTTALTGPGVTLTASLSGWCLDNTNKTSYIVRQVPDPTDNIWNLTSYGSATVDKYRFIGANSVDNFYGSTTAGYRTYWAKDPNYTADYDGGNFSSATFAEDATTGIGDNNPKYCFENTFDVPHQTYQNTTRVILGVKITADGSAFYLMGADRKTLYNEAAVKNRLVTNMMNSSTFLSWWEENGQGTLSGDNVGVTWNTDAAGVITITKITIPQANVKGATADFDIENTTTGWTGFVNNMNSQLVNVERFVGGVAYYAIRIKHFGDDLTPWNNGEYATGYAPAESTIATIYPDATEGRQTANYLGRYGMVRNNWYELVIGDILKVGSSTVPELTDHPDDDLEDLYIKARINILSWAKRVQNWNLK